MTKRVAKGGAGRVTLVGGGPGNPDLITVGGAAALGQADVVLYDELTRQDLLALASPDAICINVGKRGHEEPTRSQEDINTLAISHARAGKRVVRLKGGDSFVFGRGGEEASAYVAAGVPFEVLPGVTSALAAPAYAGIPLTDRRHAASFAVVTGHKDPGQAAEETRWSELGRAVDTLVILMGMRNLRELLQRLIEGGKSADTPAAAIMNGSLPEQQVEVGTLSSLPDQVEASGLGAPAAIVVGSVVKLREVLSWHEQKPLFGLRALVTRAPHQAEELSAALRAEGAIPVNRPMIEFEEVKDESALARVQDAVSRLGEFDDLILPSANAVHYFVQFARAVGGFEDPTRFRARVVCMGANTAKAAIQSNLPVHVSLRGGSGDARALLDEILIAGPVRDRRVLIPRSDLGRDVLENGLSEAGAQVESIVFYRNVRPHVDTASLLEEIQAGELPVLTFCSPSAVNHFLALLDDDTRSACGRCIIVAIGETTGRALREGGLPPDVMPEQPGAREMVAALVRYKGRSASGELGSGSPEEEL